MAEWLRRLTRNQFPSGSVGSNPTDCEVFNFYFFENSKISYIKEFESIQHTRHRWFSGRMLACHAGGPGSIPGRCKSFGKILEAYLRCKMYLEAPGIDPGTSRMLSERSTI